MDAAKRHNLEDQQVESALGEINFPAFVPSDFYLYHM